MSEEQMTAAQKALQINLDPGTYGTFAEIGAGQEVARWFFRVGAAAGTVAKSMSAYDMQISDAIYGHSDRYVSRERLQQMLDHEYELLIQRLSEPRGGDTRFFVFADTVAARGFKRSDNCHGWMGVRFQRTPGSPSSDIVIHVTMLDVEAIQQQESLGLVGVNLVYGALYLHENPIDLIVSLHDNLGASRVRVDMIKFSGPAFENVDNRLMSLVLVEKGLTNSAMFTAGCEVVQESEFLYKKSILVERGSFRPVTNLSVDMLKGAYSMFVQEPSLEGEQPVVLMEMTLPTLVAHGRVDYQDFLDRVDVLCALGRTVMISNYVEFHRLAAHLFHYTKRPIGLALGVPTLKAIFEERHYNDLDGGILESFGRMFKNNLRLYVYPMLDAASGATITGASLRVDPHLKHLHAYLIENEHIQCIRDYNEKFLTIYSTDALEKIRRGDPAWETMVPREVAGMIKERNLFRSGG